MVFLTALLGIFLSFNPVLGFTFANETTFNLSGLMPLFLFSDTLNMTSLTLNASAMTIDGRFFQMNSSETVNVTIMDFSQDRRAFRVNNDTAIPEISIITGGFDSPGYTTKVYVNGSFVEFQSINNTGYVNFNFDSFPASEALYIIEQNNNPPFSCVESDTYAFEKTFTGLSGNNYTVNLTSLVNLYKIKSDLTDVAITSDHNGTINTTNGYYLTVDITGSSSFTIRFGNYIANNTYSTSPLSENVTTIYGYSRINPYYELTFKSEMTGDETLPPNANVSLTMNCPLGDSVVSINDTRVLLPTFDVYAESLRAKVSYSGDYYTRSRIIETEHEELTFYLVDAYKHSVLQIPTYMGDYAYYDAKITFYKISADAPLIITEGYFDVEHKFTAYLVKDESYLLRIVRGTTTRELGFYEPVTATTLSLDINDISLTPDVSLISNNIDMAAENISMTAIRATYLDRTGRTTSLRIRVYEDSNQTAFWDTTYTGMSDVTVTISGLNMSAHSYSVRFSIEHEIYGNSPVEYSVLVGSLTLLGLGVSAAVAAWLYPTLAFILVLFEAFVIVPLNRLGGLILMIATMSALLVVPWFSFAPGVLALIIIFLSVAVVYEFKKGGMK